MLGVVAVLAAVAPAAQATTDLGVTVRDAPLVESVELDSDTPQAEHITRTLTVRNNGDETIENPALQVSSTGPPVSGPSCPECGGIGDDWIVRRGPLAPGESFEATWSVSYGLPDHPQEVKGSVKVEAAGRMFFEGSRPRVMPLDDPTPDHTQDLSYRVVWRLARIEVRLARRTEHLTLGRQYTTTGTVANVGPDPYRVPLRVLFVAFSGRLDEATIPGATCGPALSQEGGMPAIACDLATFPAMATLPIQLRATPLKGRGGVDVAAGRLGAGTDDARGPYPTDESGNPHRGGFSWCTDGDGNGDGWPDWGCDSALFSDDYVPQGDPAATNGIQFLTPVARAVKLIRDKGYRYIPINVRCQTRRGCKAISMRMRASSGRTKISRAVPLRKKVVGTFRVFVPLLDHELALVRRAGSRGLAFTFSGPAGFKSWKLTVKQ